MRGRLLLLLGLLAGVGLVSVRDSQQQVSLGYRLAEIEKDLRQTRKDITTARARLHVWQSPKRVMEQARKLHLKVKPISDLSVYRMGPGTEPSDQ